MGKSRPFMLRFRDINNTCVDDGGTNWQGGNYVTWECNRNNSNQWFTYDYNTQQIRNPNKNQGVCLDDGGGKGNGETEYHYWNCDRNNYNQKFFLPHSSNNGTLRTTTKGVCLDNNWGRGASGKRLHMWGCKGGENQSLVLDFALSDEEARCYLDRYSDLRAAFGNNLEAAKNHYNNSGFFENRDPTCHPCDQNFLNKKTQLLQNAPKVVELLKQAYDLNQKFEPLLSTANDYYNNKIPQRTSVYQQEIDDLNTMLHLLQSQYDELKAKDYVLINQVSEDKTIEETLSSSIANTFKSIYNYLFSNTNLEISIYNHKEKYYGNVMRENNMLNNKIKEQKDIYSPDNDKVTYFKTTTESLIYFNNMLYIFYCILLIVLAYFVYNKNMTRVTKILLITLFVLFPFFISNFQDNLRFAYKYFFTKN